MARQQDLKKILAKLDSGQLDLLLEMATCMSRKIKQTIDEESDILTEEFLANFSNRLIIHHATHEEKFKKKSFEFAFCSASRSAGRTAKIVSDPTNPGADVIVDNVKFSLKTEASAGIRKQRITISKLMEARWIRDCKTKLDFARRIKDRVVGHLSKYDRILTLRAFNVGDASVRYDLVEIPIELLLRMQRLASKDFGKKTKAGGSGANVKIGRSKVFRVVLDGSVEKVTISGLDVDSCFTHGSWEVPILTDREL